MGVTLFSRGAVTACVVAAGGPGAVKFQHHQYKLLVVSVSSGFRATNVGREREVVLSYMQCGDLVTSVCSTRDGFSLFGFQSGNRHQLQHSTVLVGSCFFCTRAACRFAPIHDDTETFARQLRPREEYSTLPVYQEGPSTKAPGIGA